MATEHTFSIISKNKDKLQKLYNHLTTVEQPDGVCIYSLEFTDYNNYTHLKGLLRHTLVDELQDEIKKAGITLEDGKDYLIVLYECADDIVLITDNDGDNVDIKIIASDWIPEVNFTQEGMQLPEDVRAIIYKEFSLNCKD